MVTSLSHQWPVGDDQLWGTREFNPLMSSGIVGTFTWHGNERGWTGRGSVRLSVFQTPAAQLLGIHPDIVSAHLSQ